MRVEGGGFREKYGELRFKALCFRFEVQGSGFRFQGSGFRVQGAEFGVESGRGARCERLGGFGGRGRDWGSGMVFSRFKPSTQGGLVQKHWDSWLGI